MHIELSQDEAELLREVLQNYVRELDKEINRTDSLDFKRGLQQRDRAIERILGQVVGALEHAPKVS